MQSEESHRDRSPIRHEPSPAAETRRNTGTLMRYDRVTGKWYPCGEVEYMSREEEKKFMAERFEKSVEDWRKVQARWENKPEPATYETYRLQNPRPARPTHSWMGPRNY